MARVTLRRRILLALWIYVAPLVTPWAIVAAVNASDPSIPTARTHIPDEPSRRGQCTWACHNRGCPH